MAEEEFPEGKMAEQFAQLGKLSGLAAFRYATVSSS